MLGGKVLVCVKLRVYVCVLCRCVYMVVFVVVVLIYLW